MPKALVVRMVLTSRGAVLPAVTPLAPTSKASLSQQSREVPSVGGQPADVFWPKNMVFFPWFSHDLPDVPIQNNCEVNGLELYKPMPNLSNQGSVGIVHILALQIKKFDPMDPSKTQSPKRPNAAHCG
jgi:hypothetical protein